MTYSKINKTLFVSLLVLMPSLISVNAAEEKKTDANGVAIETKPPPIPPFIKAPVIDTKYTKNCKALGLKKTPKGEKRRTFALKPANFRRMERINEAMTEDRYDEAQVMLIELIEKAADRPYDLAKAKEYLGYVYLQKVQYETAIRYFREVIDAKILPVRNEQSLIRNVAGLYLAIEPAQPDKAMGIIEQWFKTAVKPKASDYVLLGQAAVLGKMYDKSICPLRVAINIGKRPKKSWYDILVAAHFELNDFEGAAVLAKERLIAFPEDAKHWRQLSGLYNKLERSMDALVVYELAYAQNKLIKGSEFKNLASMYAVNELPYKAAVVMEDGLKKGLIKANEKTWKQAAGSWQLARENKRAINAYSKAGEFTENGLNEIRIGALYSEKENWKGAVKFFQLAISKGGLKKQLGRTHMNLGIALFNTGNSKGALVSLRKAQTFKNTKRNASQWINFVKDSKKS